MKTEMNEKEKKTLAAFPKTGEPIALDELAKKAFPSMGAKSTTRGNSWVRNSLRFLIRTKAVKQAARGLYQKCQTAVARKATSKKKITRRAPKTAKARPTLNGAGSVEATAVQ